MAKDKSETDLMTESFIREVEEDLRHEQLAKFWRKCGAAVVGLAIAIVVVVAGYQGWRYWDRTTRTAQAEQFALALSQAETGNITEAIATLRSMTGQSAAGFRLTSRLEAAALLGKSGDGGAAAAAFFEVADDTSVDEMFRNLATMLGVLQGMDTLAPEIIKDRLAEIAGGTSPWRGLAGELTAYALFKGGEVEAARARLQSLRDDVTTPPGVRNRIAEMLAAFER